ncbi:TPA: hypothetical protein ACHBVV_001033 [Streptococcus pneumoniae]
MSEKLEMRELNGGDIFTMLSIIGKLDIKEEVVALIERQYATGKNVVPLADHQKKKPTKKRTRRSESYLSKTWHGVSNGYWIRYFKTCWRC